jgi:large subunit ribosomal protein L10
LQLHHNVTKLEKTVPLNLEDKKAIVADLSAVVADSISAVAADYRGLTVSEMTELRAKAREQGLYMRVVRNTLARRAVEGTEYACLTEALVGPLVLVFAKDEPGAGAKLLSDFMKSHNNIEVKALALDGELLGADQLKRVAELPTRDQALALLMSVMQAPVTKLARTMAETYSQAVRAMGQIRDQKQDN